MIQILVCGVEIQYLSAGSAVFGVFYPILSSGRQKTCNGVSHPSVVGCQAVRRGSSSSLDVVGKGSKRRGQLNCIL